MKNNSLTILHIIFLLFYGLISTSVFGQNDHHHLGVHGGILMPTDNYKIEMVKEKYTCSEHPNVQGDKGHKCSKCGLDLIRDKRLIIYLFDNDNQPLDVSTANGRVIVGYGDETQTSKKLKTEKGYMWISLGKSNLDKMHYASVKIDFEGTVMEALFGKKTENHGHHH